jgi:hypothetical protein
MCSCFSQSIKISKNTGSKPARPALALNQPERLPALLQGIIHPGQNIRAMKINVVESCP